MLDLPVQLGDGRWQGRAPAERRCGARCRRRSPPRIDWPVRPIGVAAICRRALGGADHRPPGRSSGGPATSGSPEHIAACASTSGVSPSRHTHVVRAVPQDRRRPIEPLGAVERIGRGRHTSADTAGSGQVAGSRHRGSRACRASRRGRRHRSKPLTFFTVGPPALTTAGRRHVPGLQQRVADRAAARAA